jgi:hypothetical protein
MPDLHFQIMMMLYYTRVSDVFNRQNGLTQLQHSSAAGHAAY